MPDADVVASLVNEVVAQVVEIVEKESAVTVPELVAMLGANAVADVIDEVIAQVVEIIEKENAVTFPEPVVMSNRAVIPGRVNVVIVEAVDIAEASNVVSVSDAEKGAVAMAHNHAVAGFVNGVTEKPVVMAAVPSTTVSRVNDATLEIAENISFNKHQAMNPVNEEPTCTPLKDCGNKSPEEENVAMVVLEEVIHEVVELEIDKSKTTADRENVPSEDSGALIGNVDSVVVKNRGVTLRTNELSPVDVTEGIHDEFTAVTSCGAMDCELPLAEERKYIMDDLVPVFFNEFTRECVDYTSRDRSTPLSPIDTLSLFSTVMTAEELLDTALDGVGFTDSETIQVTHSNHDVEASCFPADNDTTTHGDVKVAVASDKVTESQCVRDTCEDRRQTSSGQSKGVRENFLIPVFFSEGTRECVDYTNRDRSKPLSPMDTLSLLSTVMTAEELLDTALQEDDMYIEGN
jgi:hypothetical protein